MQLRQADLICQWRLEGRFLDSLLISIRSVQSADDDIVVVVVDDEVVVVVDEDDDDGCRWRPRRRWSGVRCRRWRRRWATGWRKP